MPPEDDDPADRYVVELERLIDRRIKDRSVRQYERALGNTTEVERGSRDPRPHRTIAVEDSFYEFVTHVSRWIPANPSSANIKARHEATYVAPSKLDRHDEEGSVVYANIPREDGTFPLFDVLRKNEYVALIGPRGSGKTAFMNYWLTLNSEFLQNQRYVWFRIDINKIYAIWRQQTKEPIRDLLLTYHRFHTVYVTLLYGGFILDPATRQPAPVNSFLSHNFQRVAEVGNGLSLRNVAKAISDLGLHARSATDFRRKDISEEIIRQVILSPGRDIVSHFDRLYDSICECIKSHDIKMLCIIDGLDNLSWSKLSTFYVDTFGAVLPFYQGVRESLPGRSNLLIAVRPETIDEIEQLAVEGLPRFQDEAPVPHFHRCFITTPPAIDIVRKKIHAARDAEAYNDEREGVIVNDSHRSRYRDLLFRAFEPLERRAERLFGDRDKPGEIVGALQRQYSPGQRNTGNLGRTMRDVLADSGDAYLRVFFDFDVRAMLDNFIRVDRAQRVAKRANVPRFEDPERLIQYAMFNGNTYMNSDWQLNGGGGRRKDFRDRGMVFPNLFWFNCLDHPGNSRLWHGMCGLRLLQTMQYRHEMLAGDLIITMNALFGYHPDVAIEQIEAFIAFGLIEIQPDYNAARRRLLFVDPEAEETEFTKMAARYRVRANITDKGILYLDYVWQRPDIMYYFAIDAPLGVRWIRDQRVVRMARDFSRMTVNENFFTAAIPAVTVLYRHIAHFHKVEMTALPGRMETAPPAIREYLDPRQYREFLDLPRGMRGAFADFVRSGLRRRGTDGAARMNAVAHAIDDLLGLAD